MNEFVAVLLHVLVTNDPACGIAQQTIWQAALAAAQETGLRVEEGDDGNAGLPELQIHVVAVLTQPGCYIQVTTTLNNRIAILWQTSNTMIANIVPATSPENDDATRRVILAHLQGIAAARRERAD
jgi:hypothetical protein